MNEILDALAKLDAELLCKISWINNQRYVEAIIEAQKLLNQMQIIIAKANR